MNALYQNQQNLAYREVLSWAAFLILTMVSPAVLFSKKGGLRALMGLIAGGIWYVVQSLTQKEALQTNELLGKQKGQQEEEIQKIIAVRNCFSLHSEQVDPCAVDRTRHKTCHHKVLKLCLACKCPQAVIETEQIKYEQCDNNPDGQKVADRQQKRCRYCTHVKIIPDQDRQIAGGDYTDNIVYN